ncbi:transposase [Streptomyces hygroscopicus]|nr:transposase [Streptomyces hygroscopicus]
MAGHHRAELVVDALRMAHGRGSLESGCITHSDRGSEYTSAQFRAGTDRLGLRQSTGRTGSCFDNAAAESFWAVLKEEIGTRVWPDRATARADVFAFIETFYNRRRLRKHPVFGYLTPLETRQRFRNDQTLAAQKKSVPDHRGTSDRLREVFRGDYPRGRSSISAPSTSWPHVWWTPCCTELGHRRRPCREGR